MSSLLGRNSKSICGLLFLYFAGSLFARAAVPDPSNLVRGLNAASISGWALADFNGDRIVDIARSSAVGRDGQGYTQNVLIQFGASKESSFAFRSRSAKVQLGARDIDGDDDRDIVVLEALSLVPIGVWLNDGAGNFFEGDLANFKGAVDTRGSKSLECQSRQSEPLFDVSEQRIEPASPRACLFEADRTIQAFFPETVLAGTATRSNGLRSRAPPRHA